MRKNVKKIASIRKEVEEAERNLSNNETLELIRRESKERLRINEALMGLLFRLDSITGGDSGVRVFRKAVIKFVISLQEKIDDICSIESCIDSGNCSNQDQIMEIEENTTADPGNGSNQDKTVEIEESITADSEPYCVVKEIFDNNNKRNKQLLESMMEDNEKMMSLMTQLFERTEIQTRMLNTITQRVEQLEKKNSAGASAGVGW